MSVRVWAGQLTRPIDVEREIHSASPQIHDVWGDAVSSRHPHERVRSLRGCRGRRGQSHEQDDADGRDGNTFHHGCLTFGVNDVGVLEQGHHTARGRVRPEAETAHRSGCGSSSS